MLDKRRRLERNKLHSYRQISTYNNDCEKRKIFILFFLRFLETRKSRRGDFTSGRRLPNQSGSRARTSGRYRIREKEEDSLRRTSERRRKPTGNNVHGGSRNFSRFFHARCSTMRDPTPGDHPRNYSVPTAACSHGMDGRVNTKPVFDAASWFCTI